MSTEALNLDQGVEALLGGEPANEESAELEQAVDDITEEDTDEYDSEVDDSDDDSEENEYEEDDTDEESETDEYDEPDQSGPETITVKVDGEEVAVTLEDLKRSYSGQGKIQKGMQEAAEMRKQAQAEVQQAQQYAQQLAAMYQKVQQEGFVAPPKAPDRALFDSDPLGYLEAEMQYKDAMQQYQGQQQQMQQMQQMQAYQMQAQQQELLQRELQVLREKLPELGNAETATKFQQDIVKYGNDYGFSQEEIANVMDHRALLVLRDAMRWRKSQSKRTQVEQKAKGARPVIKPQAKKTVDPKRQKAKQSKNQLKKTGSIDDALRALGL